MFTPNGFSQADMMRPAVSPVQSINQPRFQVLLVSHAVILSPLSTTRTQHRRDLPHGGTRSTCTPGSRRRAPEDMDGMG